MHSPYDAVAEHYDQTRGGEARGDRYAEELSARLLPTAAPTLEVGVGTGLVSLGLRQRGFDIVGVDLSSGMLAKAQGRLGNVVVEGNACALPFRDGCFDNVVSVWMVQAVSDPAAMFREIFRVLRPGGRLLACPTNRPALRDPVGVLLAQMFVRLDRLRAGQRDELPRPVVDATYILTLAERAGFVGHIEQPADERWTSTLEDEIRYVEQRTWAPLGDLDPESFALVTGETLAALRRLPPGPKLRRAVTHVVVLDRPCDGAQAGDV